MRSEVCADKLLLGYLWTRKAASESHGAEYLACQNGPYQGPVSSEPSFDVDKVSGLNFESLVHGCHSGQCGERPVSRTQRAYKSPYYPLWTIFFFISTPSQVQYRA